MQTAETLARRGGLFQLLDESAQSYLLRFCDDEEFHADALRPAPAHRGILDFEREDLSRQLQEQRHLHSSERRNQAFDTTALRREVADGTFVPKLVALNKDARHADEETTVFASDHSGRPSFRVPMRLLLRDRADIAPAAPVEAPPCPEIRCRIRSAASTAQLPCGQ